MTVYVVTWQSPTMAAPAFIYFKVKLNADTYASLYRRLDGYTVTGPSRRVVPTGTVLSDGRVR